MTPPVGDVSRRSPGVGLLIDPPVITAKRAIVEAYERAARDEATLFLAYIGHGEYVDDGYYLLTRDAQCRSSTATNFYNVETVKAQASLSAFGCSRSC